MKFQRTKAFSPGGITLAIAATFFCSTAVNAASFSLDFHNENNEPQAQVVAALIPLTATAPQSHMTAIMDQRNNAFVPGVLAIRTNTLVHFPNSDDIRHHVYSFSPAKRFELRLYHGKTAEPVLFDQPGQVVLGCNIHDSMLAYIYVVDSEFYGVADVNGNLLIENIPAGEYQLEIQHPDLKDTVRHPEKISFKADEDKAQSVIVKDLQKSRNSAQLDSELKKLFKRKY